jgi:hypothetical protein
MLTDFVRVRPYLYHLTNVDNLRSIRRDRTLYPAGQLFARAGQQELLRQHRPEAVIISVDGESIHVRDQAPLKQSNLTLSENWTLQDVVELLNGRVFFWPGRERGPILSGVRHYERYAGDPIGILRAPSIALISANAASEPQFCKWNSGAPRWSQGRRPVRDRDTFLGSTSAPYAATNVIELTYVSPVLLPEGTVVGPTPLGPWRPL